MAYETGTATDHMDLLAKLRAFATANADLVAAGQEWTELHYDAVAGELVLRGPGLAGQDEVYVGASVYADADLDEYGLVLQGFTGWLAGNGVDQPGAMTTPPLMPLWDGAIPYWFVGNGRRLVVVAKVSSSYEAAYLGLILPYGSPGQYPYPLCVGGSMTGYVTRRFSETSQDHSHFVDPRAGFDIEDDAYTRTALRLLHGQWLAVANREADSSLDTRRGTHPYCTGGSVYGWTQIREQIDGGSTLFPIQIFSRQPEKNVFGQLDGCFAVSGHGLGAEDVLTIGSVDHLVVQNVTRSGRADYWALALD